MKMAGKTWKLDSSFGTSIRIQDVQNIAHYNWNNVGEQTRRQLSNYWIGDGKEMLIHYVADVMSGFKSYDESDRLVEWFIIGDLMPIATSDSLMVRVNTNIKEIEFDFGTSLSDSRRGLWIKNEFDTWFKLSMPQLSLDSVYINSILTAPVGSKYHTSHGTGLHVLRNVDIRNPAENNQQISIVKMTPTSDDNSNNKHTYTLSGNVVIYPHITTTSTVDELKALTSLPLSIPVKLHIVAYTYDIGFIDIDKKSKASHTKDFNWRNTKGYWLKDVYSQWYHVEGGKDAYSDVYREVATKGHDIVKKGSFGFEKYNHRKAQVKEVADYRRITDYAIRDFRTDEFKLITDVNDKYDLCVLSGYLEPQFKSRHVLPAIHVSVYTDHMIIDRDEDNRGMNLMGFNGVEYRCYGACHPDYSETDRLSSRTYNRYMRLFAAIVDDDKFDLKDSTVDAEHYQRTDYTIQRGWRESGMKFDLQFVEKNKEFVKFHLSFFLCPEECKPLFDSIDALGSDANLDPSSNGNNKINDSSDDCNKTDNVCSMLDDDDRDTLTGECKKRKRDNDNVDNGEQHQHHEEEDDNEGSYFSSDVNVDEQDGAVSANAVIKEEERQDVIANKRAKHEDSHENGTSNKIAGTAALLTVLKSETTSSGSTKNSLVSSSSNNNGSSPPKDSVWIACAHCRGTSRLHTCTDTRHYDGEYIALPKAQLTESDILVDRTGARVVLRATKGNKLNMHPDLPI